MLNRIKLNESELKKIIENSICNILNEYHAEQRLPFDDKFYGKKNQLEQYKDWLEDFGKYGELPPSSLNFYDELKKALKVIESEQLHGRFDANTPKSSSGMYYKLNGVMFRYLDLDDNGNLYIERSINVPRPANFVINDTYHELIKNYNNNVGGCWSYKKGGSNAYCGHGTNLVILRGRIRIDDIDFIKTALLNFIYDDEHEIRVKPNAKIALDNFSYDEYTVNFKTPLIVSGTYFGNNGKFTGDYAPVDDGFGNKEYIDRQGNITSKNVASKRILDKINYQLKRCNYLEEVFKEVNYDYVNGIDIVRYDFLGEDMFNYVKDRKLISPNLWFDDCGFFSAGLARVSILNEDGTESTNYLKEDGTFLKPDEWFDGGESFDDGIAKVEKYINGWPRSSYIKTDGSFLVDKWFDKCDNFFDGLARVAISNKGTLEWYLMDENGNFLNKKPFFYCDALGMDNMVLVGTYNNEGKRVYDYFDMTTKTFVNDANKIQKMRDERSF